MRDIPDQSIRNLEAYIMATNPPQDIAVDFAKLCLEVRRRRFEEIGQKIDLEWRKNFTKYSKHLPICDKLIKEDLVDCTCGLIELLEKAKFV